MALADGRLALDIITDQMMREEPDRSALFLIAVMYDFLTASQIGSIRWRNVDLEEGLIRINSTLTIILPGLIHELLEDARARRSSEPRKIKVFPPFENRRASFTTQDALNEFREIFSEYKRQNLTSHYYAESAKAHG